MGTQGAMDKGVGRMLRRMEFVSGLTTSVFGVLGWAYAAFGPAYRYAGSIVSSEGRTSTTGGSTSIMQKGLGPAGMAFFVVMLIVVVGFAACAYLHSRRGFMGGLPLLWTLTAALWIGVAVTAASIGMLLLPAALLAAVTSVVGNLAQRGRS